VRAAIAVSGSASAPASTGTISPAGVSAAMPRLTVENSTTWPSDQCALSSGWRSSATATARTSASVTPIRVPASRASLVRVRSRPTNAMSAHRQNCGTSMVRAIWRAIAARTPVGL
jgi:hypothetical protein